MPKESLAEIIYANSYTYACIPIRMLDVTGKTCEKSGDSINSFLPSSRRVDSRIVLWLEGLGQLKNPMTLSGFETAIFQLVA
jgi:hypothetical protein